ncbi:MULTISPECIES: NucA/NucB deoxyribonuclease domain-containing protein [Streptomyces]|uniref:NucA/NucB deoxyribonuclease domain-containing protein n=1 Tax=Streptomyces TaxID=1883 RepID=UPI00345C18A0
MERGKFTGNVSCSPIPAEARAQVHSAVTACVSIDKVPGKAGTAPTGASASLAAIGSGVDDPGTDDPGTDPEFEPDTNDPEPPPPSCMLAGPGLANSGPVPGQWAWSRTGGLCLNGADVTYTLYDEYVKPVGTGLIQVNSTLATSYKSLDLNETITVKLLRVTGQVKSLGVKMEVNCDAGCTTKTKQPWLGTPNLIPGQEKTGRTKYSADAFAVNTTRSSFQTHYKMYVLMPGAVPVDPTASWSSPAQGKIRCDKEQPRLRGCVIPTNDLPVLSYSRSHAKHGIVVPIYEEIMKRRGTDILHAVNQTTANANRSATCEPFTNLYPGQRNADTCDEFPPASTREGGQDGDLCAELTPQIVNGVWSAPATWPTRPTTGTETCVRLHVTGRANYSAGGVLGSLRKFQRLVDGDPFRIEFTA